ncbi:MAG: histidinol-phosphate aminotransferase family protein [Fimbriimonadaceae bacterium]|nr:MAG: histidinol-phosphate aminotransferase family protein [Fimbriimonadaceae bacterium]
MHPKKSVHGGDFFKAIGEDFASIELHQDVISADVLDAWYPPAPGVITKIRENLEWLITTSPPTHSEGLKETLAEKRGIAKENILLGSGTSSLMFWALPKLLNPEDDVLILDPSYGEYVHIAQNVIGCKVTRFELPLGSFELDTDELIKAVAGKKMAILVNPNSPTGRAASRKELQAVIQAHPETLFWVDETYIDFYSNASGESQSLESLVSELPNLIVSKSMSKYYALSGLRLGCLVASEEYVSEWELFSPPWAVGMMAQIAGIEALKDEQHYWERSRETAGLRNRMARQLEELGLEVFPSVTNFLLCRLPANHAQELCDFAAERKIYLRNCDSMSPRFKNDTVRIAVKNADANRLIVSAIAEFLA